MKWVCYNIAQYLYIMFIWVFKIITWAKQSSSYSTVLGVPRYFPGVKLFKDNTQGVPINMGIQWRIRYRLCYELAL